MEGGVFAYPLPLEKITVKLILEHIQEHLESLIDRGQAGFLFGSFCVDYINKIFAPIDFEKDFANVNNKCIWRALLRG